MILWNHGTQTGSPLPSVRDTDFLLALSDDGLTVWVGRVQQGTTLSVVGVNVRTQATESTMQIPIEDPTGIMGINRILMTPDGKTLVYSYVRHLSQLFVTSPIR